MITKILTGYTAVFAMALAFALIGITFAYASEVTGTLSSDAVDNTSQADGNLAGTVTGGNSGGSSGGGSSGGSTSGSTGGSFNSSTGSVLGATTDNLSAPAFPNAGFAYDGIK